MIVGDQPPGGQRRSETRREVERSETTCPKKRKEESVAKVNTVKVKV